MMFGKRTPKYSMAEIHQQVADISELQRQRDLYVTDSDRDLGIALVAQAQRVLERMYETREGDSHGL